MEEKSYFKKNKTPETSINKSKPSLLSYPVQAIIFTNGVCLKKACATIVAQVKDLLTLDLLT